jgi:hypothetical protein
MEIYDFFMMVAQRFLSFLEDAFLWKRKIGHFRGGI